MNQQSKLETPEKRWENQLRSGTGPGGRTHYNLMEWRLLTCPFEDWAQYSIPEYVMDLMTSKVAQFSMKKKLEYQSSDAAPHL
jgi:hypothetical protein